MKDKTLRERFQESLEEYDDEYKLKTGDEFVDLVIESGCCMVEVHTVDINLLISEKCTLAEMLQKARNYIYSNCDMSSTMIGMLDEIDETLRIVEA